MKIYVLGELAKRLIVLNVFTSEPACLFQEFENSVRIFTDSEMR